MCPSGLTQETTSIISNEEMKDVMKIVNSFEESGLLTKGAIETIENESKERKGEFCSMSLGTCASLSGNLLTSKYSLLMSMKK